MHGKSKIQEKTLAGLVDGSISRKTDTNKLYRYPFIIAEAGVNHEGDLDTAKRLVLEAAEGGVLLLDEAYQLGDPQGRDSYASECINTLNQYLSENSEDFMCIVAGYKDKMYKNFFSMNPGLDRRFTWKFTLKPYTTKDLVGIFDYQISIILLKCFKF